MYRNNSLGLKIVGVWGRALDKRGSSSTCCMHARRGVGRKVLRPVPQGFAQGYAMPGQALYSASFQGAQAGTDGAEYGWQLGPKGG